MDFIVDGFYRALVLLIQGDPQTLSAVTTTLKAAFLSMGMSLVIGVPAGFCLGYYEFRGKKTARTIVDTMLALPTVFIGLLVYAFLSNRGPLGGLGLLFTIPAISVGQTILALPVITALTASTLDSLDKGLRLTLVSLGADKRQLFLSTLWEVRYGIVAAAMTAMGRVMTEVGISMMVGGNIKWHTRTITTAIALETGKGMFAEGIALGLVLLAIALVVNVSVSVFRR